MSDKIHILYKGKSYIISNKYDEDYNSFIERAWFIVKNYDKKTRDELENLSRIYIEKKILNVDYSDNINNELKFLDVQ